MPPDTLERPQVEALLDVCESGGTLSRHESVALARWALALEQRPPELPKDALRRRRSAAEDEIDEHHDERQVPVYIVWFVAGAAYEAQRTLARPPEPAEVGRLPRCQHCEKNRAACIGAYEGTQTWIKKNQVLVCPVIRNTLAIEVKWNLVRKC